MRKSAKHVENAVRCEHRRGGVGADELDAFGPLSEEAMLFGAMHGPDRCRTARAVCVNLSAVRG